MNLSLALSIGKRESLYCDEITAGRRCDYPLRLGDGRNFWDDGPTLVCDQCGAGKPAHEQARQLGLFGEAA